MEFEGDTYGIAVFADSFKMEAAASVIAEGKSKSAVLPAEA